MVLACSSSQLNALKVIAVDQFVSDAISYLDRSLCGLTAFYGKAAIDATIRYGIERARLYGIVAPPDVCLYLRLMFTLMGTDFDRDPLYPWVGNILEERYYPSNDRIMRLIGKAYRFLEDVKQREPRYYEGVLTVTRESRDLFRSLPDAASLSSVEESILSVINRWFPGKLTCVGEDNVKHLITRGVDDAHSRGLQRGPDVAVFVQFMFIYGSSFFADPKYPQVSAVFSDPTTTGTRKAELMFTKLNEFLLRNRQFLTV